MIHLCCLSNSTPMSVQTYDETPCAISFSCARMYPNATEVWHIVQQRNNPFIWCRPRVILKLLRNCQEHFVCAIGDCCLSIYFALASIVQISVFIEVSNFILNHVADKAFYTIDHLIKMTNSVVFFYIFSMQFQFHLLFGLLGTSHFVIHCKGNQQNNLQTFHSV